MIQRNESCSCGAGQWVGDDEHKEDCYMVGHQVFTWPYPEPIHPRELIKDENSQQFGYRMPAKWKDWGLVQRGARFLRTKMLCRSCVLEEMAVAGRVAALQKAKKSYGNRGATQDSWSQQICSQDSF